MRTNATGVLVVTGMHRSGTSLLASVASHAGIDMGRELLAAGKGNRRGHFEDLTFVAFHDRCLETRQASPLRPPAAGVAAFDAAESAQARELVASHDGLPRWGWKDPRTSLFLGAWEELLPAPNLLLVYRHPVEVALSLLRRGLDLEVQLDPWTAIHAWTTYNRLLLACRERCPERSLLWSIAGACRDLPASITALGEHLGMPLGGRGLEKLYADDELQLGLEAVGIAWQRVIPEAMEVYARLEAAADLPAAAALDVPPPASPRLRTAKERDLQSATEHLLAAALAAAPPMDGAAPLAAGPARRDRIDYSELHRQSARQAERIAELSAKLAAVVWQRDALNAERSSLEATRGWRLVHGYWGAARRWQGVRRQGAWRLTSWAGALPAIRADEVLVGCVAENQPRSLAQARRLVRSLRDFGGGLAAARVLVCVVGDRGDLDPRNRAAFATLGAAVQMVPVFDPRNRFANKLQFYPAALASGAVWLLLLDCDTAIVGDPLPLLTAGALQAKIADLPTVSHETFVRLFRHFGLPLPRRRYRTTVEDAATILYCNSGVVFLPSDLARAFAPVWRDWNLRILEALPLMGAEAHHCHQASLSLALAAHPIPFAEAGPELNFPLHLQPAPASPRLAAAEPVILHYHDRIDGDGCLLPSPYPRAQARIEALNQRRRAGEPSEA